MPDFTARPRPLRGGGGYSIIFQHPARLDEFGEPGRRVRFPLRGVDRAEAERLCGQIDALISATTYHEPEARDSAKRHFDARAVDIFFGSMAPERRDFRGRRDEALPLPPRGESDGYRHVLLLGATGAGKTTLVRQIIGTDVSKGERFPSTSTAKTTIHDTEIVIAAGASWRAVVTFESKEVIFNHLLECASRAVVEAYKGSDDTTIMRYLLDHVEQRFRFSYVLGKGPQISDNLAAFDDIPGDAGADAPVGGGAADLGGAIDDAIDMAVTNGLLTRIVEDLKNLAHRHERELETEIDSIEIQDDRDDREAEELFAEGLEDRLKADESFLEIIDALIDEIEKRFNLLPRDEVIWAEHGWPLSWKGSFARRDAFLKSISTFSSNYAPLYGRLLTPLVSGIRVAGPFSPDWQPASAPLELVLVDGEGLGHTPESSAAVSTPTSRAIQMADAVVLVDNAMQPMQAGALAAIREIVQTGNGHKLILAFTHFDEVKGDNFVTDEDKADHVRASVDNAVTAIGKDLGPQAERVLRKRVRRATLFLAELQNKLSSDARMGKPTIRQLQKLLEEIGEITEDRPIADARPVYSRGDLISAVNAAVKDFHDKWRIQLGIEYKAGSAKAHWQTIKALTRRLAEMGIDEFRNLRPVADLPHALKARLYRFFQSPERWIGIEPSEGEKEIMYDKMSNSLSERLLDISRRRIWEEREAGWRNAYRQRGRGSTFVRAHIIDGEIYEGAAPSNSETASISGSNAFLREVGGAVKDAMAEVGADLR